MKDAFDQYLYRPQVEVAREMLQARDLLIDLEKVALHPARKGEWKVVSDLNVEIVEDLKLKQPVFVTLFIARRLREAPISEEAGAIRTAHAQLKELKAIGGKDGFAELANWGIPSPRSRYGMGSATNTSTPPPPPPPTPASVSEVEFYPLTPATSVTHTLEGLTRAGEGTPAAGWGTTAP